MASNKFDLLGPALADIGKEAMHVVGGAPDSVLVYAEIGNGWVEPSLFKDEGASVRYVDLGASTLGTSITDAWCIEPADKRWTAMRYTIDQGKFHASFDFDDLEHSEEDTLDRRTRAVRARFGDKPIVYPPLSSRATRLSPPS